MGRFSKLEPNQPAQQDAPEKPQPTLETRLEPGAVGAGDDDTLNRTAAEWLDLADRAFLRDDTKSALRLYSRALDRDSTLLEGWVAMIRVLLFRGDLGPAETWNNRALALFPESARLLAMRAVVHARRGKLREGLNSSDALITQNAADPLAQIARGEVLLLAENKTADFCMNQALTLVPANDWKTPATIAMIYEERRLWAKALQFYSAALERDEFSAVLWFRSSRCRAQLGQTPQARKALEQARELCPPNDPLLLKIDRAGTGSFFARLAGLFHRGG